MSRLLSSITPPSVSIYLTTDNRLMIEKRTFGDSDLNRRGRGNTGSASKVIALYFLLLSASDAVAQIPRLTIPVIPQHNPSSPFLLPAPGPVPVSPTAPTLRSASDCCHGTHPSRHHRINKNHAYHRQPADTLERISEAQRRAAARAERAIDSLIGKSGKR